MGITLLPTRPISTGSAVITGRALPAAGEILIVKVGCFIHVKVDVNRFQGDQRGEDAGTVTRGDQITAGDQRAAGAAINRRGHFGEIQLSCAASTAACAARMSACARAAAERRCSHSSRETTLVLTSLSVRLASLRAGWPAFWLSLRWPAPVPAQRDRFCHR